jgi:hypothetical protein
MPGLFCYMATWVSYPWFIIVAPLTLVDEIRRWGLASCVFPTVSFETTYRKYVLSPSQDKRSMLDTALEGSSLIWRGG